MEYESNDDKNRNLSLDEYLNKIEFSSFKISRKFRNTIEKKRFYF